MQDKDIRDNVSEAYAASLRNSLAGQGGCCSAGRGCGVTQLAGYDAEMQRFAEAAQSSFGCGNPLAFSAVRPGETVLDLGSGAGFDLLIAADKVGPQGRVIGVDMTDEMLDAARANVARAGKHNVELRKGYIEDLPVDSASVDWVISNCVINLSPDKPAVFREIARVLRPGGRIAISDIVAEDLPSLVREDPAAYYACIGGAINEADYLAGLGDAGFADVRVTERIVYTAEQLEGMLRAERTAGLDLSRVRQETAKAAGKIWSARFEGRKA